MTAGYLRLGLGGELRVDHRGRSPCSPRRRCRTRSPTLGKQFEAANPGTKVTFSFGASSALAEQIGSGGAGRRVRLREHQHHGPGRDAGDAADPTIFVDERDADRGAAGQPRQGRLGLDDLAKPAVKIALCQAEVPCGAVALQVFENAKITVTPVTEETDVKAVLSKVHLGEVDAGVVYVTDVLAAGDTVKGVEIPADVNASTTYPIAALTSTENQDDRRRRSSTTCSRRTGLRC